MVSEQYVFNAEEIEEPNAQKEGFEFEGWQPAIENITDNTTYTAKFKGVEIEKTEIILSLEKEFIEMEYDEMVYFSVNVTTESENVTWTASADNENISFEEGLDVIDIYSEKAGVTILTIKAEDSVTGDSVEKTCKVVVKPQDMTITAAKLGDKAIEQLRTLAAKEADGSASQFNLDISYGAANSVGEGFAENIVWETDDSQASINNGVITLNAGSDEAKIVNFKASFKVDGEVYAQSNTYSIRCVWDGVNVGTYAELVAATKEKKEIVLKNDIQFPTNQSEIQYDWMETTYDDTYYVNRDKKADAKVKVLLSFKNDLYGNGYQINAHNAAYGLDAYKQLKSDALFQGPLNFVALSDGSSAISVKAQDNICFALYEGVTVNNVELRGCDLVPDENNNYDLTDLTYVGTTVEVLGDDVTIEYSRITNGRTTLRIFGYDGSEQDMPETNVTIKNSVLSGAREFIIRMGSNYFVDGTDENPSPYIDTAIDLMNTKKTYATKSASEKSSYEDKYVKTFVTVENSVFEEAGIFAVGIDSHFAGGALQSGHSILESFGGNAYWKNLAKTSYGAKLTFKGDVKMYNWKRLDDIDSSTLIDNKFPEDSMIGGLTFVVKDMVRLAVENNYENLSTLLTDYNGEDYVHAGIAFFGGGKNYGVFEWVDKNELVGFEVSLADVGKAFLTAAAGNENFYFMLYDSKSGFSPEEQENNKSYDCLYK